MYLYAEVSKINWEFLTPTRRDQHCVMVDSDFRVYTTFLKVTSKCMGEQHLLHKRPRFSVCNSCNIYTQIPSSWTANTRNDRAWDFELIDIFIQITSTLSHSMVVRW